MTDLQWQVQKFRPLELRRDALETFVIEGWAFERRLDTRRLWAQVDERHVPAVVFGIESPGTYERYRRGHHRSAHAARCEFIVAGIVAARGTASIDVHIGLELEDGSIHVTEAHPVAVRPFEASPVAVSPDVQVAIVMVTYDPRLDLFARQIETIRDQTHDSWCCVISDDASNPRTVAAMRRIIGRDPRFHIIVHPNHVGFYRNVERALAAVPDTVRHIALADQDDSWRPNKLARLLAALAEQPDSTLAASDARIVAPSGAVLAESFYADRRLTFDDPYSLFLVNSLIGASMVFPRSLLDIALPFPRAIEGVYHDHWIARIASLTGTIVFVEEPLHDYVQHGGNVLGHTSKGEAREIREVVTWALRRFVAGGDMPADWRRYYLRNVLEPWLAAQLLTTRLSASPPSWLRRVMELHDGRARELWQLVRDYRRRRRHSDQRRDLVEPGVFAGRAWALEHRTPTEVSRRP